MLLESTDSFRDLSGQKDNARGAIMEVTLSCPSLGPI